jgi:endonuclease/exonuclease/phosphatase family metal-dependent hydrolase
MYSYADYPPVVCEDVVRLRRRLDRAQLPPRRTDDNLVIGTWNIRHFGQLHPEWTESRDGPKRNLRALAYIAEIVRRFDVVAVQEIKRETTALRVLVDEFLGANWGVVLSDVSAGAKGNEERLGYLYDRRRVTPSGLAGEIVLPPRDGGDGLAPAEQFDRTPYVVGFRAGTERFALLTVHIRYGGGPADRRPEVLALARYTADEIRDRARFAGAEETNLIVLGDFNIDARRAGDPLYEALLSAGLTVPEPLRDVQTNYAHTVKHYDQIAWFMGELGLLTKGAAGVIDYRGTVYKELTSRQVTDRVSDHLPLWVEFVTDRSTEAIARTLGVDLGAPEPFAGVPD